MSAPRRDRLEAHLAALHSSALKDGTKGRWQRYAAVTGSAIALAANAPLPSIGAGMTDFAAQHQPLLRSVKLATAARNSKLFAAAAAMQAAHATQAAPAITAGGVVSLYSSVNTIQPGGWVSIYGSNLATGTAVWNGDFPMSLGGTSVTINGKPAYLSFVSSGQINLQAPDDTATGMVQVAVTTGMGTATSTVTLAPYSPSFNLLDARHVSAIIIRGDGSGAYANGAYDILGPTGNCWGFPTRGANPGDLVELFGVGFGPTDPVVQAGKVFSGAAPIVTKPFALYIDNVEITPLFVGMSSAGLYQINLIVPAGLGQGDVPVTGWVGANTTQDNVWFTLAGKAIQPCMSTGDGGVGTGIGDGGDGGIGDGGIGDGDGDGGGDGGGGDGGDGGGGGDGGDGGDGDGG